MRYQRKPDLVIAAERMEKLGKLIDEFGDICLQYNLINRRREALRRQLCDLAPGVFDGESEFDLDISTRIEKRLNVNRLITVYGLDVINSFKEDKEIKVLSPRRKTNK